MLRELTLRIKRNRLANTIKEVEAYAMTKRKWDNNLSTAFITTKLVIDNIGMLFDQKNFIRHMHGKTIESYFADIVEMCKWLKEVTQLLAEFAVDNIRAIPDNKTYLNVTTHKEVSVINFIESDKGMVDIKNLYSGLAKTLRSMEGSMDIINNNSRAYLDMRLVNGFNTIIVFNEQLLEVMLNDK